jgi:hypothetical protein
MYSGVIYYKGQTASRFALCSNNASLRLTTPQIIITSIDCVSLRKTNTGEAGICWAKVVRPCIYE